MHINQYLLHFDFKNFIIEKKIWFLEIFKNPKKQTKFVANKRIGR